MSRPTLAIALLVIVSAGAAWRFTQNKPLGLFQSSSAILHPTPNPPLAALDRISASFEGPAWTLPVVVRGSTLEGVIETSRRLQEELSQLGLLSGAAVLGAHTLLPEPTRIQSVNELQSRVSPSEVVAQFQEVLSTSALNPAAFKDLESSLNETLNPPPPPTASDLPVQLGTRFLATDGTTHLALVMVRLPGDLDSDASRPGVIRSIQQTCDSVQDCTLTGFDVVRLDVEQTLRTEFPVLALTSALAVGFWLVIFFASARAVALALVPVVFGVTCLFLIMIALDIRLDMISLAAIPLLIGIGVDDGIFMVGAARAASRTGCEMAHTGSRHAIVTTSITTAGSFGSLVTTSTPAIQTLGLVVALGVLLCLAGAELVLVPLLGRAMQKGML